MSFRYHLLSFGQSSDNPLGPFFPPTSLVVPPPHLLLPPTLTLYNTSMTSVLYDWLAHVPVYLFSSYFNSKQDLLTFLTTVNDSTGTDSNDCTTERMDVLDPGRTLYEGVRKWTVQRERRDGHGEFYWSDVSRWSSVTPVSNTVYT